MRTNYDFSKGVRNSNVKRLKQQITIRLETEVIQYFKVLSVETGIPYQNLINLYLRECANESRKPAFTWRPVKAGLAKR